MNGGHFGAHHTSSRAQQLDTVCLKSILLLHFTFHESYLLLKSIRKGEDDEEQEGAEVEFEEKLKEITFLQLKTTLIGSRKIIDKFKLSRFTCVDTSYRRARAKSSYFESIIV